MHHISLRIYLAATHEIGSRPSNTAKKNFNTSNIISPYVSQADLLIYFTLAPESVHDPDRIRKHLLEQAQCRFWLNARSLTSLLVW